MNTLNFPLKLKSLSSNAMGMKNELCHVKKYLCGVASVLSDIITPHRAS